jgi:hypothetical protein
MSLGIATVYRLGDALVLAILFFMVVVEGAGLVAGRRVDRARFSIPLGVCRWRVSIHDRRSSGASLTDVSPAMTSSLAAQIKAFVCLSFS